MCLGTYYPQGGFAGVVEGFSNAIQEKGVKIHTSSPVTGFDINNHSIEHIKLENGRSIETDLVVGTGDYAHIDGLLDPGLRNYKGSYWSKKVFAPSALLFFIGLDKKLDNIKHHNLFFHAPFDHHI